MDKKILVAYHTNAGSTAEVADAIAQKIKEAEVQVDVALLDDVQDYSSYDAVVIGSPVQMWERKTPKLIKKTQTALSNKPVAYFFTGLRLTKTEDIDVNGISVYKDPAMEREPKKPEKLGMMEKRVTVKGYLEPVLKKLPDIKPISVAFLAGKLDYSKLGFFSKLLLKLFIRAKEGDYRNWDAIREWAASLIL